MSSSLLNKINATVMRPIDGGKILRGDLAFSHYRSYHDKLVTQARQIIKAYVI